MWTVSDTKPLFPDCFQVSMEGFKCQNKNKPNNEVKLKMYFVFMFAFTVIIN